MQTISNATVAIREIWELQHPIMHRWFVYSALSICFMFLFLFFVL